MKISTKYKDKCVSIEICHHKWEAYIFTPKDYEKYVGPTSSAMTYLKSKHIVFNKEDFNESVVRHELMHAFIESMCFNELELTKEQFEEGICELNAKYGVIMNELASKVYNELKVINKLS